MSNNYQCHITINNRGSSHLILDKANLDWGEFEIQPVKDIPPKTEVKAFVAVGKTATPTGPEGNVSYRFESDANLTFNIYFDVPFRPFSKNKVDVTTSNDEVVASRDGFKGEGNIENCVIKIK
jgi:Aegerolysin